MDYLSIAVAVLIVSAIIILVGGLPGFIASQRHHSNVAAVRVCGYCGLVLWPVWIVAIVWACVGGGK